MKAFVMAVGLLCLITLGAMVGLDLMETTSKQAFTEHTNVRN